MDLHAEYARTYGGPPRPDQSWHEVLAMARRVARFDARARMIVHDGSILGNPVDAKQGGIRQMQVNKLRRLAGELA